MGVRSRRSQFRWTAIAGVANLLLPVLRILILRYFNMLKRTLFAEELFASTPRVFNICNGRKMGTICSAVVDVKNVNALSNVAYLLLIPFAVYVWRIRDLSTSALGIGVVCEHVYTPESEHADLRLMSFDVTTLGSAHTIAMVFSDSSIKVK
jgi:hypothetical protein